VNEEFAISTVTMTEPEAVEITAKIKLLVRQITSYTEKVLEYIEDAKTREAWKALGYSSWTLYVSEEFTDALAGLRRVDRVPIVEKLSATGMSTRAISPVVGVSQGQVVKDLSEVIHKESRAATPTVEHACSDTAASEIDTNATLDTAAGEVLDEQPIETKVIGLDGKTYRAKPAQARKPASRPTSVNRYAATVSELSALVYDLQRYQRRSAFDPSPGGKHDCELLLGDVLKRLTAVYEKHVLAYEAHLASSETEGSS
jgi:hypothetical protein